MMINKLTYIILHVANKIGVAIFLQALKNSKHEYKFCTDFCLMSVFQYNVKQIKDKDLHT